LAFRPFDNSNDRPLLVQLVNGGKIVGDESPCGERHLRARAGPPLEALKMSRGEPVIETVFPGTGDRNPYRTQPSGELRAAGGVGDAIAGPTREL
jgi:nicotinate phosphoribosyltransferase